MKKVSLLAYLSVIMSIITILPKEVQAETLNNEGVNQNIGWVQRDDGLWNYFYSDGTQACATLERSGWVQIDGKWYAFEGNGNMAFNGIIEEYDAVNHKKIEYYVGKDGALTELPATGWVKENAYGRNSRWRYRENNSWVNGWKIIYGEWYYFYSNGEMATNTVIDGYLLGEDGILH